jgi:hypothetical protein
MHAISIKGLLVIAWLKLLREPHCYRCNIDWLADNTLHICECAGRHLLCWLPRCLLLLPAVW